MRGGVIAANCGGVDWGQKTRQKKIPLRRRGKLTRSSMWRGFLAERRKKGK